MYLLGTLNTAEVAESIQILYKKNYDVQMYKDNDDSSYMIHVKVFTVSKILPNEWLVMLFVYCMYSMLRS